jgi:hypothetical protein
LQDLKITNVMDFDFDKLLDYEIKKHMDSLEENNGENLNPEDFSDEPETGKKW